MHVQLLTLRYEATRGAFDPGPLDEFLRDHSVVEFREHFFVAEGTPHLLCVLTLGETTQRPAEPAATQVQQLVTHDRAITSVAPPREPALTREPTPTPDSKSARSPRAGALDDVLAQLSPADRQCFEALRRWRLQRSRKEGLPPYVVLTNKQLLALVRQRPTTPAALQKIDRIGAGKVGRYGASILALLHGTEAPAEAEGAGRPEPPATAPSPPAAPDDPGAPAQDVPVLETEEVQGWASPSPSPPVPTTADSPTAADTRAAPTSPTAVPPPPARAELLVLVQWEELAGWLLEHTGRWPRSARFTLAQRVQTHVLDVLELLVEARYEPRRRRRHLQRVNLLLERLRFLLRMARDRQVMPARGFETAMKGIDETGRMVHGWRKKIGLARTRRRP